MVLPLHDENPLRRISAPYVNWALVSVTSLIFVLVGSGLALPGTAAHIASFGLGLIPAVLNGHADLPPALYLVPEILTPITYMFLHADWMHLIGNMLFLWVFGDNIEDALGHWRYLLFYLICGVCAGLVFALLGDQTSQAPLIGASGAVSGIVAAYLLLFPRVRVWVLLFWRLPLPLRAEYALGLWISLQVWQLFAAGSASNVAWLAHIGGLAAGAIFVMALKRSGVPLFGDGVRT